MPGDSLTRSGYISLLKVTLKINIDLHIEIFERDFLVGFGHHHLLVIFEKYCGD